MSNEKNTDLSLWIEKHIPEIMETPTESERLPAIDYFLTLSAEDKATVRWYVDLKAKACGKEGNKYFIDSWRQSISARPDKDFTDLKALRQAIEIDKTVLFSDFKKVEENYMAMATGKISFEEYNKVKESLTKQDGKGKINPAVLSTLYTKKY